MSSRKLLAIAALAVVGAAACVNGDASTGQVKDAMRNAGANDEQAECIGNRLEGLSQEQLNDVSNAEDLSELAGVDVAGSDQDLREFLRGVLARCMGEESPDTTSQEGEEPSDGGETDGSGNGEGDSSGGE